MTILSHCTMGKLKKIAESGQLWELISPQFLAENTYNLARCCVNSPIISEKNSFEKTDGWRASWLRVGHALPSTAHTLMQLRIETFISFYPTHFSIVELSKERTCSWSQSCAGCCRHSGSQHRPTPISSTRGSPGISKNVENTTARWCVVCEKGADIGQLTPCVPVYALALLTLLPWIISLPSSHKTKCNLVPPNIQGDHICRVSTHGHCPRQVKVRW